MIFLALALASTPHFDVVNRFTIGGEGGWDYLTVDAPTHRLYISRGTHVQVMDTESGKIVGDIPNTQGVHGIALAPKLGKGFVSNGRDNSVTVFDIKTLKETSRVKVGQNPDAIWYDQASNHVFTFNGRSSDASVLDASSLKVVGTIPLGGKPEFPQTDGKGRLWVNIEDKSTIAQIDTKTLKVTKTWPIAPGEEASGLAIDLKHHRLFSVCGNNKMAVSDYEAGKVIGAATIGNGPDAANYDPALNLAFSSNGQDGTMSIVDASTAEFKVVQEVKTQVSARTMTYDAKHHLAYLIAADFEPAVGNSRRRMKPNSAMILVVGIKK